MSPQVTVFGNLFSSRWHRGGVGKTALLREVYFWDGFCESTAFPYTHFSLCATCLLLRMWHLLSHLFALVCMDDYFYSSQSWWTISFWSHKPKPNLHSMNCQVGAFYSSNRKRTKTLWLLLVVATCSDFNFCETLKSSCCFYLLYFACKYHGIY